MLMRAAVHSGRSTRAKPAVVERGGLGGGLSIWMHGDGVDLLEQAGCEDGLRNGQGNVDEPGAMMTASGSAAWTARAVSSASIA